MSSLDEALCQIEACGNATGDVDAGSEAASIFRLGIDQGVKAARVELARERRRTAALEDALRLISNAIGWADYVADMVERQAADDAEDAALLAGDERAGEQS